MGIRLWRFLVFFGGGIFCPNFCPKMFYRHSTLEFFFVCKNMGDMLSSFSPDDFSPRTFVGIRPWEVWCFCEILWGFLDFQFQDGSDGEVSRLLS